ncbi:MAG: ATP-binding protein [Nitrospirota bacterium]
MKIRSKIIIITTSIVIALGMIISLLVREMIGKALREELQKRGVTIVRDLADRIANATITEDIFLIEEAIKDVLDREKDIEYIFILRYDGSPIAHTFKSGLPEGIETWNPTDGKRFSVQLLDTERGYIRDIAYRVLPDFGAEVHVGINEESIQKSLENTLKLACLLTFLFTGFGAAVAVLFSQFITSPMKRFMEFTKRLGEGDFDQRITIRSRDEIRELAERFNELSMRLKKARDEMESAHRKMLQTEKLAALGQLSAGIAHELKNPLTSIKMLFQSFIKNPEPSQRDIEVITEEINRMDDIITRVLGFSRTESLDLEKTSIVDILRRVIILTRYRTREQRIDLSEGLDTNIPLINVDKAQLEQVFFNLILNAIQAMPQGGKLRVSATLDGNGDLRVAIADTGNGIPLQIQDKVFDPFFTTKEDGTGLGLSVAYAIVKAHGGNIWFESLQGNGTTFFVTLPVD